MENIVEYGTIDNTMDNDTYDEIIFENFINNMKSHVESIFNTIKTASIQLEENVNYYISEFEKNYIHIDPEECDSIGSEYSDINLNQEDNDQDHEDESDQEHEGEDQKDEEDSDQEQIDEDEDQKDEEDSDQEQIDEDEDQKDEELEENNSDQEQIDEDEDDEFEKEHNQELEDIVELDNLLLNLPKTNEKKDILNYFDLVLREKYYLQVVDKIGNYKLKIVNQKMITEDNSSNDYIPVYVRDSNWNGNPSENTIITGVDIYEDDLSQFESI
jgi:hypothetical protein